MVKRLFGMVLLAFASCANATVNEYQSNDLQIVITPDGYPIIWSLEHNYSTDLATTLANTTAHTCLTENGVDGYDFSPYLCSQAAGDDGATHYRLLYVDGVGEHRIYFNGQHIGGYVFSSTGEVVGIEQTSSFVEVKNNFQTYVNNVEYEQTGDTIVPGTIAGEFGVSPTGGANYSFDIVAPPGVAGMKPELGLSYSSTAGNGYVGVGWNITGLSEITHCQLTIASYGTVTELDINGYEYCIDGQPMRWFGNTKTFVTENESFRLIEAYDYQPDTLNFKVTDKAGLTHTYYRHGDGANNYKWLRTVIEDTYGNKILYTFYNYGSNGEHQLQRIRYASGLNGVYYAKIEFDYSSRPTQDQRRGWVGGVRDSITKRLSRIRTYASVNGNQYHLGRDYRFKYEVDGDSGASLLTGVKLCSEQYDVDTHIYTRTATHCYEETRFDWQYASTNIGARTDTGLCGNADTDCDQSEIKGYVYYPDINGDSKSDICYISDSRGLECKISNGSGAFTELVPIEVCGGDIDGDGSLHHSSTHLDGHCHSQELLQTLNIQYFDGRNTLQFVDINADGRDDVIWRGAEGIKFKYSIESGSSVVFTDNYNTGLFVQGWHYNEPPAVLKNSIDESDYYNVYLADLNGNGLPDLCYRSSQGIRCHLNTGDYGDGQWSSIAEFDQSASGEITTDVCADYFVGNQGACESDDNWPTIRFVDINSDGRQDLVYRGDQGMRVWFSQSTNTSIHFTYDEHAFDIEHANDDVVSLCRNDASDIIAHPYVDQGVTQYSHCNQGTKNYLYFADINGDGNQDFCYKSTQGIHCWKNAGAATGHVSGSRFVEPFEDIFPRSICSSSNAGDGACNNAFQFNSIRFVDINADGKSDLTYRGAEGIQQWLSTGKDFIHHISTDICRDGTQHHGMCDSYDNHFTLSYYADFNGDTKQDIVYRADTGIQVWIDNNYRTNLITSITNGMGESVRIEHARLSDPDVYMADANAHDIDRKDVDPTRTLTTPMSIVKSYAVSNGVGGELTTRHYYKNLKLNMHGRGLIGFETVETLDDKGIYNWSLHEQENEFNYGAVKKSKTIAAFTGELGEFQAGSMVAYTESTYQEKTSVYAQVFYAPDIITSYTWELMPAKNPNQALDSGYVTKITDISEYDNYGNIIDKEVITRAWGSPEVYSTHTVNQYSDNLKGRLERSSVTKSSTTEGSQTKVSAFTYNANGLIESEIVEPDDPVNIKTTTYTYDNYGNQTVATLTVPGEEARTSRHVYSYVIPRFASVTINAEAHRMSYIHDVITGKVLSQRGPYYVSHLSTELMTWSEAPETVFQYDGFGRERLSTLKDSTNEFADITTVTEHRLCSQTLTCPTPDAHYYIGKYVQGIFNYSYTYYDSMGREIQASKNGFNGHVRHVRTEYDEYGRVDRKSRPYITGATPGNWTSFEYDALDRPIQTYVPALNGASPIQGNALGNPEHNGAVTETIYEGLKTTTRVHVVRTNDQAIANSCNGGQSEGCYNSTQDTIEYKDAIGRMSSVVDANGVVLNYDYSYINGNSVTTVTDPAGMEVITTTDIRDNKITMTDPDMGTWTYEYSGYGELKKQTDNRNTVTDTEYDRLGRVTNRVVTTYTTDASTGGLVVGTIRNDAWNYDTEYLGKVSSVTGLVDKYYTYDSLGRQSSERTDYMGLFDETVSRTHDSFGRPEVLHYPNGFSVTNVYNTFGYLQKVVNTQDPLKIYWEGTGVDAEGNMTSYSLGNGLNMTRMFSLGHLISAGDSAGASRDRDYYYDSVGNLMSRVVDAPSSIATGGSITETFAYDNLNRVTAAHVVAGALDRVEEYAHDELGNLTHKQDISSFIYDPIKKRRLTEVIGGGADRTFDYDENGNIIRSGSTNIQWDGSNRVSHISSPGGGMYGSDFTIYQYDAVGNRTYEYSSNGGGNKYHYYLLPSSNMGIHYEKTVRNWTQTTHHNYIYVGGSMVAMEKTGYQTGTEYYIKDHLGSIVEVFDESLNMISERSFDAYGQSRTTDWATLFGDNPPSSLYSAVTDRGYTGHQHIFGTGFVHMNGRIYDPVVGRFLSADPFIQYASNLQSYNRYAYVLNNPLNTTDPTGYLSFKQVLGIAVMVYFGTPDVLGSFTSIAGGSQIGGAILSGMTGGFINGVLYGGDLRSGLKGAAMGGLSGGLFGAAGAIEAKYVLSKIAAHGLAGGILQELTGGSFGAGFRSGAFKQAFAPNISGKGRSLEKAMVAIVVGGTASVIGGGKYSNGAASAAFAHLFRITTKKSLHSGSSTTGNVSAAAVKATLGRLRGYPEFAAIEDKAGTFNLVVDHVGGSNYDHATHTITVDPGDFNLEYKTVMPPGYEESLSHLSDTAYWNALEGYPQWYAFSAERILFHEASHALQDGSALGYALNREAYEMPVINSTNQFMYKHFGEPYRANHTSIR